MGDWIALASLAFTILTTLAGAAWVLMNRYFEQKEKLEDLTQKNTLELIKAVQEQIKEMQKAGDIWKRSIEEKVEGLRIQFEEQQIVTKAQLSEMRGFRDDMGKIVRHFAGARDEIGKSEVREIAKDTFRIRTKKPGDKP